ncbi:hypothetical protein [Streptomyces sp. NBC_01198]|uniref:hypothetical protein n=1 Tax=Streptomyces sp. NBC_01198 TaxID=2903769 RepID=UPI002E0F97A5|nr:hypothetical protein OG702_05975 [Streptomyces sp. NBC_01198]
MDAQLVTQVRLEAVGGNVEAWDRLLTASEGVLGEPLSLEHVPGCGGGDDGRIAVLGFATANVEHIVLGVVDLELLPVLRSAAFVGAYKHQETAQFVAR